MKFSRDFQFTAAPGVSVAGVISIPLLSRFMFKIISSRADVEIPITRRPVLLMKWKRSSESANLGRLMVGWIRPASS